jgi:hypothetical protein
MRSLRIYMRPGCHLCEEAEARLQPLADAIGGSIERIDIEQREDLHKRFLVLIPVIEVDGVELARLDEFRDGRLERALAPPDRSSAGPQSASY